MSEKNNDCAETRAVESRQQDDGVEDEENSVKGVEDKVSIEQILEGMTNEFNRSVVNNLKIADVERTDTAIGKADSESSINENAREEKNSVRQENSQEENSVEAAEDKNENCSEASAASPAGDATEKATEVEELEKPGKQETSKKDNNIPRIVLTFRTMNENTDYGRKTKISSCSSNLSLVPDELGNCDQIGGVSVKIEHSDENSDHAEKSDNEEGKAEDEVKVEEKTEEAGKIEEDPAPVEAEKTEEKQPEKFEKKEKPVEPVANENAETETVPETVKPVEPEPPVTRKRRAGRARLRVMR